MLCVQSLFSRLLKDEKDFFFLGKLKKIKKRKKKRKEDIFGLGKNIIYFLAFLFHEWFEELPLVLSLSLKSTSLAVLPIIWVVLHDPSMVLSDV